MKKIAVFVLALLCVVALVGCSPAHTEESVLLKEGTVKHISVSSWPEGYNYSYTGESAQAIVDYLSGLDLKKSSTGAPPGMAWDIILEYEDGSTVELCHAGNSVIRVVGDSQYYKMTYEQASAFDSLLWELNENK